MWRVLQIAMHVNQLKYDINNDHSHDRNNYGDNSNSTSDHYSDSDNSTNNTAAATLPRLMISPVPIQTGS